MYSYISKSNCCKYTIFTLIVFTQFLTSGPLAEVHMPVDRETRRMKGFATVTFVMPEQAVAAYSKLDGTVFHGRMLHLLPAKTRHSPEGQYRYCFNISLAFLSFQTIQYSFDYGANRRSQLLFLNLHHWNPVRSGTIVFLILYEIIAYMSCKNCLLVTVVILYGNITLLPSIGIKP